eukprot:Lithocolla_globosa_v1_NODE_3722_length_1597_cov_31.643969.p2 type:complete len:191 gc:universal NODE_3722_length_1597_cov_31.643969:581-1153(+)
MSGHACEHSSAESASQQAVRPGGQARLKDGISLLGLRSSAGTLPLLPWTDPCHTTRVLGVASSPADGHPKGPPDRPRSWLPADGAQVCHCRAAAARGDPRARPLSPPDPQKAPHPVPTCHSRCATWRSSEISGNHEHIQRNIQARPHLHPHSQIASQCDQDWSSNDQPLVFAHPVERHLLKAPSRQHRGC